MYRRTCNNGARDRVRQRRENPPPPPPSPPPSPSSELTDSTYQPSTTPDSVATTLVTSSAASAGGAPSLRRQVRPLDDRERNWKLKGKVREYNGKTEDPLQWLKHIQRVFVLSDITRGSLQIKIAISHLVGAAQIWAESTGIDALVDWALFEKELLTRFRPSGFQNRLQALLHNLRQDMDQSVSDYSDRYLELCNLIMVVPDVHVQGFIEGLRPAIRRLVLFEAPTRFVSARDSATRAEAATGELPTHDLTLHEGSNRTAASAEIVPRVETRYAQVPNAETEVKKGPILMPELNERYLAANFCWCCGKRGHWKRDCPLRTDGEKESHAPSQHKAATSHVPPQYSGSFLSDVM